MSSVSPRRADQAVRGALVEAAARRLRRREALTARGLAADVGTSTMSVYTHFGGMEELRREVRAEAFVRLGEHLAAVERSRDPVADLCVLGWAYCVNALENPDLYRAMFMEVPVDTQDADTGRFTFQALVDATHSAVAKKRFADAPSRLLAVQLWTMVHGLISLVLAGALPLEELIETIPEMARNLFVGFGDTEARARRSIRAAVQRMQLTA